MKGEDEWDKIFTKVRMNGMKGEDEWDKIFTKVRMNGMKIKKVPLTLMITGFSER